MTLGLELTIIRGILSWSLMPGMTVDLSTEVGLVVKNKSRVFLPLVGSVTICSSPKSLAISIICFERPGVGLPGLTDSVSQFMPGKLKSPASQMLLLDFLIFDRDSRSSFKYSGVGAYY